MIVNAMLATYGVGVLIGLLVMRDGWGARIVTAALWPLGILAFLVVIVILGAATVYLWPIPALVTLALVAAAWLLL